MDLPNPNPETTSSPNSKKRAALVGSFFIILIIVFGLIFNKQAEKVAYNLLGKVLPGPHVTVEGTEVKGFIDGKKVDHLAGVVKNIEASNIGTRLTIEWGNDERVVIAVPDARVYFGPKQLSEEGGQNTFRGGEIEEIEIGDDILVTPSENLPNGEFKAELITVVR